MKKQILTLMIGLASIMSIHAQISEAKNALANVDKHFFIENKGQWPDEVLYLTRIGGIDAWITQNGVLYDFYKLEEVPGDAKTEEVLPDKFEQKDYTRTGHKIWYKLQGNNILIHTEGKEKQTGYYNYLIGNDPGKHASNVGLYREALVKNVYDGIDMRYYFDKGNIRYDYVVHSGSDPSQIIFALEGTDKTYLNAQGDLVFHTRFGQVALAELQTYQGTKDNKVSSSFIKIENGWSISIGQYNNKQTLIIDPLIYSTYLGGNGNDHGASIALDASGNAYVTGVTYSNNYGTTSGAYQTSCAGDADVFVTKLNATGTALVYSTYLGGSGDDRGTSIAIDISGNAYVMGMTGSKDYDITSGAHQRRYAGGNWDVFVTKLNATGTALVYSTYLGGSANEYGFSIAINSSGNAYVTGATPSTNYPTTSAAYQTSLQGSWDVFVTKLNVTGTALVYSTYLGGSNDDLGTSITIDTSENVYVTGYTTSTNYDISSGAYQTSFAGGFDAFVTKLNASGTALVYSTYLGGNGYDQGYSIAINASGNAYITGTSSSDYDTTSGAYQTSYAGGFSDVFVTKLNTTGTALVYSTYLGGSDADFAFSIAVDVWGNVYVTGYTKSTDYDTTSGAYQTRCADCGGRNDVFLTQLNTTGTALVYSTYLGGNLVDEGRSITVDASGNAYITGYTESSNYDITSGAYQTSYACNDVFVTKICLVAKATVSLSLSAGADSQSLCIYTSITDITYATTNATYATVTGLPAGVKGNFASNAVTISGTPVGSGTYHYTLILSGGCSIATAKGTIIVKPYPGIALASASGTDSQSVCINNAITNITYVTTDATGATFTGLPAGLKGRFVSDVITIRGTPSANGTFSYTVTFTGECGTSTAKGSIIVKPDKSIALSSASGKDSQSVCMNTSITDITYVTTDASGATVTGLPAGVTGSFASNKVTISGTPKASGTFSYTVTLAGGCGTVTAKGVMTVKPDNFIGLASGAGTDSQSVCQNIAIIDITYTTTGATGATFTGLPAGITGSFVSNEVVISGAPTAIGTFHFNVILTGGCGTLTAKGSMTVNPDNTIGLSSASGTDSQSVCINTAITGIIYTTKDATGATVTGLPAGVTGSFASDKITISGTPTASGTFPYTVTLSGGCGTATAKGSMTVKPDNKIFLSSTSGTDAQSVKLNSAITNIIYATRYATGATFTGLPAGVTGSFATNEVIISGTPTANGTYNYTVTLTGGCGNIKTTGSIHVGGLGIADQANRKALEIFPNPSDIQVSIQGVFTASVQIEIIDALGRISQAVYSLDANTIKVQVSSLENGMYCIRIIDGGQVFQSKIIVQH